MSKSNELGIELTQDLKEKCSANTADSNLLKQY